MQTAVINIKTEPKVKKQAHEVAKELGFSLSSLIDGYLRHLIRTKEVHFRLEEIPSEYMIKELKESEKQIKEGWVSPGFDNVEDAITWLDNPKRKYVNQLRKKV